MLIRISFLLQQLVVISLYTTGRKEEYFKEPSKFEPQRWIRDKETGKHQVTDNYACLPFGLGVRSCIGRRVAEVQMQFFISRVRVPLYSLSIPPISHATLYY